MLKLFPPQFMLPTKLAGCDTAAGCYSRAESEVSFESKTEDAVKGTIIALEGQHDMKGGGEGNVVYITGAAASARRSSQSCSMKNGSLVNGAVNSCTAALGDVLTLL